MLAKGMLSHEKRELDEGDEEGDDHIQQRKGEMVTRASRYGGTDSSIIHSQVVVGTGWSKTLGEPWHHGGGALPPFCPD